VAVARAVAFEGANPAPVLSPAAPTVDVAPPVEEPPTIFLSPLNLTPAESLNQF
jgi:hypothetical protein